MRLKWVRCATFFLGLSGAAPIGASRLLQAAGAAANESLSVVDLARVLQEMARIDDVRLSPDGSFVVYSVSRGTVQQNRYLIELRLQQLAADGTATEEPLRLASHVGSGWRAPFSPRWCPDSRCITYFSRTDAAELQAVPVTPVAATSTSDATVLVRYDVASRHRSIVPVRDPVVGLVRDGTAKVHRPAVSSISSDYRWSPKGRFLTFTAPADFGQQLDPRQGLRLSAQATGRPAPPRRGLFVLDPSTGKVEQVSPTHLHVREFAWAPDEGAIAISATSDTEGSPRVRSDLYVIDAATHAIRPLVTTPGADSIPTWSPDGRWIAFSSQFGEASFFGGGPAVVPAAGGAVIRLSGADAPRLSSQVFWAQDSASFYYPSYDQMSRRLIKADLATSHVAPLIAGEMFVDDDFDYSASAGRFVFTRSSIVTPPELVIRDQRSLDARSITRFDPDFPLSALVSVDRVNWTSLDRRFTVHGLLLTPTSARRSTAGGLSTTFPLPLVVYLEGGPAMLRTGFREDAYAGALMLLAAHGYAVLLPNTRGRPGYGEAFERGIRQGGGSGQRPYEDLMAGVDHLIDRGIADPKRLGVFGHSYGAYLTSFTITQTGQFRAAVVYESTTEQRFTEAIVAAPGTDWELLARDLHGIHAAFGPEARDRLTLESPALNMDRVSTPTLFLYGAQSSTNAIRPGVMSFAALHRFGIPSEYVLYDEGHGFQRPAALVDTMARTVTWFDYWVRGLPHPEPERARAYDAWRFRVDSTMHQQPLSSRGDR